MSLTNNISIRIISTLTGTSGVAALTAAINVPVSLTLPDATDSYAVSDVTPADPFAKTYDLADDSLADPLGDAVSFEQLEFIYFKNKSSNALTLGGGANDIAVLSDGVSVPAGGVVLLTGVYDVGASADQITVTGTAAGDGYDLVIIGGDAPAHEE